MANSSINKLDSSNQTPAHKAGVSRCADKSEQSKERPYFVIDPMDNEHLYGYRIFLQSEEENRMIGFIFPHDDGWKIYFGVASFEFVKREISSAVEAIKYVRNLERILIDFVFSDPCVFEFTGNRKETGAARGSNGNK